MSELASIMPENLFLRPRSYMIGLDALHCLMLIGSCSLIALCLSVRIVGNSALLLELVGIDVCILMLLRL